MIDAKLKDAIAIGPHLTHVSQAGGNERSSRKGEQGDAANNPSFDVPCSRYHLAPLESAN
jgi:hypothetical protein